MDCILVVSWLNCTISVLVVKWKVEDFTLISGSHSLWLVFYSSAKKREAGLVIVLPPSEIISHLDGLAV